jgi:hypothetical protein
MCQIKIYVPNICQPSQNVFKCGYESTQMSPPSLRLHSGRLPPYPQMKDKDGNVFGRHNLHRPDFFVKLVTGVSPLDAIKEVGASEFNTLY